MSFWFCADSMLLADRLKLEIMLAPAELSVVIDQKSRRAVHNHGAAGTNSPVGNRPHGGGYMPPQLVRGQDGVMYTLTPSLGPPPTTVQLPPALAPGEVCEPCEPAPQLKATGSPTRPVGPPSSILIGVAR